MNPETASRLLAVSSGLLAIAGLILLAVCIFSENEGPRTLSMALMFILLGNLFNIVRLRMNQKK